VLVASLLVLLLVVPVFSPAIASTLTQKQAELNTARAQMAKLQDSLDALTKKFATAEANLAQTEDAITAVQNDIARSNKDLGTARTKLAERVVNVYKDGHSSTPQYLAVLFSESDFVSVIKRFSLLGKLADQDKQLLEQVKAHLAKSQEKQTTLTDKQQAQAQLTAELESVQAEMYDKMKNSAVEYRKLKQQVATLQEEARKAAEEAARIKAQEAANRQSGGAVQPGSFVFPVDGPHSYIDTFGAPRSGGRTHKGCDIMSPKGTPAVACVSGTILRTNPTDSGLGGISVTLRGKNGNNYFYAHFDGIASGIHAGASVKAGQILGWVGDTGDAAPGAYHLHFEIRPGGGASVNPYATLRNAD
jgi:murein DD-endopeptidase MepM/ murein hydrolase activator NlpD